MADVDTFLAKRDYDFIALNDLVNAHGRDLNKIGVAYKFAFEEVGSVLPLYYRHYATGALVPVALESKHAIRIWETLISELTDDDMWPDYLPDDSGKDTLVVINFYVKASDCSKFFHASGLTNPLIKPSTPDVPKKMARLHYTKKKDPKPANWDFWLKCNRFDIQELIWLSLDIEPGQYNLKNTFSDQFSERFELLIRNLKAEGTSQLPMRDNVLDPAVFIAVAAQLDWLLPEHMAKLPTEVKQAPASAAHSADDSVESLGTRERNTLLCIIAALCKYSGLDHRRHAKAAVVIQGSAAELGVTVGESTIEGHLKKIQDALESRMK